MDNYKGGGFKKKGGNFGGRSQSGGDRGGSRHSGGGNHGGHKSGGRPPELFKAECSKCHKACTLPFRPNGEKPVFCSYCFAKNNADNDRGPGRRDDDRGKHGEHTKLPRDQRSPRHDRPQAHQNKELADVKRQLSTIEDRLNRILDIINPPVPPKKKVEKTEQNTAVNVSEPEFVVEKAITAKKVAKKSVKKVAKKTTKKTAKKAVKKGAKVKK